MDETNQTIHAMDESPAIRKDTAVITSERYQTSRTSPLIFHFEAKPFKSTEKRLQNCKMTHESIEGKDIYIFDDFFLESEGRELREFSKKAEFGRTIYADQDSREKGEEPARAMDNKEKWLFFSNPPQSVKEIYKLLSFLAHRMDADIATLPWELYDQELCAPAFATNRVEKVSHENTELGKHDDYNTERGIAFGIPILYPHEQALHPSSFINGDLGKPWLVTLMLYVTSEKFIPEHGMGTIFCKKNKETMITASCKHMRFVLFEGDIIHSIQESKVLQDDQYWRVSYVYKISINPKNEDKSMKNLFSDIIHSYQT